MIPFPRYVDNSMLDAFKTCPQKAFKSHFEHWKPREPSVDLHAGKAYASGLEVARRAFYERGWSVQLSKDAGLDALEHAYGDFECPEYSPKTRARMLEALDFTLGDEWALGADKATPIVLPSGKRGIEFSFAEPLPVDHPETGDPVIFVGRADQIVSFLGGAFVEDDKTTGKSFAYNWADQWELRAQFSGYVWAARRGHIEVDGCLVRGLYIGGRSKEIKKKCSECGAAPGTKHNVFCGLKRQQHVTYRQPWEVERWLQQTVRTVGHMIEAWRTAQWDYNLGDACSQYRGCHFLRACKNQRPEAWMPALFVRRRWDPLTREEVEMAE